jgi:hypothetical protein
MGNGAIGNGAKAKESFKDFLGGVKDGIGTVLKFGQDILKTPGVTDLINIGTKALGVPLPVCNMISTCIDFATNMLEGGSQKRDILKDPNKYDFKSSADQFSSLIKRKVDPIWKK